MGFVIPALISAGSAIAGTVAAGGTALAATSLTGLTSLATAGVGLATALSSKPKSPTIAASAPIASPFAPSAGSGGNKSLAALAPGIALAGTASGSLGGAPAGQKKTLLGQ